MNIIKTLKEKTMSSDALAPKGIVMFLNPYTYLMLRKMPDLLGEASYIYIDGEWLRKFMSWFAIKEIKRVSFDNTSLAPIVFKDSIDNSKKVAIVGSSQESIVSFCDYLRSTYTNIEIVYSRNGYFKNSTESSECQNDILDSGAHLVVVGMGAVKQENFSIELVNKGFNGVVYTCGGFIHQTAKSGHEYYPKFFDKFNLRFLYRMIDEPKLVRRYFIDYPQFVVFFIYDLIKFGRSNDKY